MTQPTLSRRGFLGALTALVVAPKALEKLAAMQPELPLWVKNSTLHPMGRFSHITLQKAYRKMQVNALEGFNLEVAEWREIPELKRQPPGYFFLVDRQAVSRLTLRERG